MLGLFGCLGVALDALVEPVLLFFLSMCKVEHQAVEQVGMANQEAEIMIGLGSLLGELAAGSVGDVVSLGESHLLLLLSW